MAIARSHFYLRVYYLKKKKKKERVLEI